MTDETSTLTTHSDLALTKHVPIMVGESIQALAIQPQHWYIDATAGGGGHSLAILHAGGNVLALDRDEEAVHITHQRLSAIGISPSRFKVIHAPFSLIHQVVQDYKITPQGIFFDLGISSDQLDHPERGFSFRHQAYLDMRMDRNQQLTAADILNHYSEKQLADLLFHLADERDSRRIAKAIVEHRAHDPIISTDELVQIITEAKGKRDKIHPATLVFQALRMAVNQELEELASGIANAWQLLPHRGRLAVISFHSGEDRIVKKFFQYQERFNQAQIVNKKPIQPTDKEITQNPRSRSAKLRAIIKNIDHEKTTH